MDTNTLFSQTVVHHPMIEFISIYGQSFLIYDLKNAIQRVDLMIHHLVVIFLIYINFSTTITSLCLFNEIITVSYLMNDELTQWLFRIIAVCFIRYPIWIITYFTTYNSPHVEYFDLLFSKIIIHLMLILDVFWLIKYVKNYRKKKNENSLQKKL